MGKEFNLNVSENKAMFASREDALNDRKQFVSNLGVLLSQTRRNISGAELNDNDIVTITYKNGHTRTVNVEADSYSAIISDVMRSF